MARRVHGKMQKMTREDRQKRAERNERRGRNSQEIAHRKNKIMPDDQGQKKVMKSA